MGILDVFKANENEQLKQENAKLKALLSPEQSTAFDLKNKIEEMEKRQSILVNNISSLNTQIKEKQSQLVELDDEILYQSFALYKPLYDFATSDEYKKRLDEIRSVQKNMIKNNTAVSFNLNWTVNGSKVEGKKLINSNIKQILRSFNVECENVIDRVKFNNIDSMKTRITKSYEQLNSLNKINQIYITQNYLNCKLTELSLAYEYQVKKQEEKEEQKRIRAELREQAKVRQELEEAHKNIMKDLKHFTNALSEINDKLDNESDEAKKKLLENKKIELETTISDLNEKLKDIDYRQSNQKAGYVYVISNIGSFGENVYKIGMTRRLEPLDRISELSDASVPFNFDVHALIFTEDAPKLESALHKAFENKKVNMINHRREFFKVTLDEIKTVINNNYDKTIDFVNIPPAEQYRETLKILKK